MRSSRSAFSAQPRKAAKRSRRWPRGSGRGARRRAKTDRRPPSSPRRSFGKRGETRYRSRERSWKIRRPSLPTKPRLLRKRAANLTANEIRDLREQWARIWQEQKTQAEQELEKAKDDVYQCRSAERYFFVPIAVDCEGVDLRLAAAESRLKTIKRNRYHWELLLPENTNR